MDVVGPLAPAHADLEEEAKVNTKKGGSWRCSNVHESWMAALPYVEVIARARFLAWYPAGLLVQAASTDKIQKKSDQAKKNT